MFFQPISLKSLQKVLSYTVVLLVIGALGFGIYRLNRADSSVGEEVKGDKDSAFEVVLEPIYVKPTRILIESVGIDVTVEEVGVAKDGSLETPSSWSGAGWYKDGAMAGEAGNLLIDAHYDDNYGRPAAFNQLKNVKVDDKVTVVDFYGRRYVYNVSSYSLVGINDPNRAEVFKSDGSAKITLITCGGVWIPGRATYDKRLVIKGELIH